MKVVCLYGSPRKQGNSTALARHFLDQARQRGASIEEFYLNGMALRGCQGCNRCKTDLETCVLKDDLTPVLDAVFAADLLVFASPVYYGDVSAQLKMFIDRSYSYLKPNYIKRSKPSRLPAPKPLVFILSQGHSDVDRFADILPRYSQLFSWTAFADTHPLRLTDVYFPDDHTAHPELLAQADALADQLFGKP